jgi:hypothetical protein
LRKDTGIDFLFFVPISAGDVVILKNMIFAAYSAMLF